MNTTRRFSWTGVRVALAAAIVGGAGLLSGITVQAAPLAVAASAAAQSQDGVTLVRDGCGPGMRFSNRMQACVEDYAPPPPPVVYQRPVGCPPGTRYSNRMEACVEMGPVDPGAAIVNGIINGVTNGGCPPGTRFSNSRQRCVYD